MHDADLYEYAVLRYVPRVEREEFINVGLVMMCKRQRWMRAAINVDPARLAALGAPHSSPEVFLDKYYPDEYMDKIFANKREVCK